MRRIAAGTWSSNRASRMNGPVPHRMIRTTLGELPGFSSCLSCGAAWDLNLKNMRGGL